MCYNGSLMVKGRHKKYYFFPSMETIITRIWRETIIIFEKTSITLYFFTAILFIMFITANTFFTSRY